MEILNPDKVCEWCHTEYTKAGEWVMDSYTCPNAKEFCVNCCGCPEHEGEPWYE